MKSLALIWGCSQRAVRASARETTGKILVRRGKRAVARCGECSRPLCPDRPKHRAGRCERDRRRPAVRRWEYIPVGDSLAARGILGLRAEPRIFR